MTSDGHRFVPQPVYLRPAGTHARVRLLVGAFGVAAVLALIFDLGFAVPPIPVVVLRVVELTAVGVYLVARAHQVYAASNRRAAVQTCAVDAVLLGAAGLYLLLALEFRPGQVVKVSALCLGLLQAIILIRLAIWALTWHLALSQSGLQPTRVLTLTFLILILLGTLALSLPKATQPHVQTGSDFTVPRHLLNCLFTATSATCVTGLTVYDTGGDFTRLGQIVILVLIQAGGLGIMIFGGALGVMVGQHLSVRQSLVLQDALSHRTLGQLKSMVVFIVAFTGAIEFLGTVLLMPLWPDEQPFSTRLFLSVFHAVSAFCNAGFALQSDSLVSLRRAWPVYGAIMPLIVLGGLGFPVLHDLWRSAGGWLEDWRRGRRPRRSGEAWHRPRRFSLHTRLVLWMTAMLVIAPTLAFVIFESLQTGAQHTATRLMAPDVDASHRPLPMAGDPVWLRLLDGLFYSITCRTAGFNTVPMDAESLSPASHLLGVFLMFIGGSPASAAGGIKTVCLAVLLLGVWSTLHGRSQVEVHGRTISDLTVRRAAVVAVVMMSLVSTVTLLLCFTENVSIREALFEAASACGTVGLSTGLTPELSVPGRIVIILAMFTGRLGPLTVLIALAGKVSTSRYSYPPEEVAIG